MPSLPALPLRAAAALALAACAGASPTPTLSRSTRYEDLVSLSADWLARANAALKVEEHKNRALPPQAPIAGAEEHQRRFGAAVTEYMAFLAHHQILTVQPYMDPALRARTGEYVTERPLEFFSEVDYR